MLDLLAEGLASADIAERLVLFQETVARHVSAVLRKPGEPARPLAVAAALRRQVIAPR